MVLRWPHASCVVLAGDVLAIDEDGPAARVHLGEPPMALASRIPGAVDDPRRYQPLRLIVRPQRRNLAFRAAAAIEIHEGLRFYSLPRLLLAWGCPPWLRGFALVRDDLSGEEQPLPWLHLGDLAEWHDRNQAHLACAKG
jgi:hypothetical protein